MRSVLKNIIVFLVIIVIILVGVLSYQVFSFKNPFDGQVNSNESQEEVKEDLNGEISEEEIVPEEPVVTRASLFMVGDALIHSAVYADADTGQGYDFKPMLSELKDIVEPYDLAFYNQETILGGTELGLSTYPRFNSPYEVGDAFLDTGFNLVSLANNHTLDRGESAILNSRNYWNQKDAYVAGSYSSWEERNQIVVKEINGIRYSFFSYTDWTNGLKAPSGKEYFVNCYSEDAVRQDIETVRNDVDIIIVSMHFGDEYSFSVSNRQREIANFLASLGVDVVIGHHPHVVQPIEMIDDTLVVYSLGNVLSAQRGVERLTGMMFSMDIVKTTEDGVSDMHFENMKAGLVYTYSEFSNGYRYNFKVYPYQKLTDSLLSNHEMYYNRYMEIILQNNYSFIERW